eukprot:PhF_6_TR40380/c1_g7_i3/m.60140
MSGWSRRLRFRETTIQRVWRGQRIRRHLTVRNKTETVAATRLQSVWRGHIVRQQQGKNYNVATNTTKGPNNNGGGFRADKEEDDINGMNGAVYSSAVAIPIHGCGPYEIGERIGGGGSGTVFVGRDVVTGEHVAIKEIRLINASNMQKVQEEYDILRRLRHSNVVAVHGIDVACDCAYIITEWMPGGSLSDMMKKNELPAS